MQYRSCCLSASRAAAKWRKLAPSRSTGWVRTAAIASPARRSAAIIEESGTPLLRVRVRVRGRVRVS